MQLNDIAHLNNYLQRLYGERYAGLTAEMGLLWHKHLMAFPLALAEQAVERWAATHLLHQIPTLTDIEAGAEDLEREQRKEAYQKAQQSWSGGLDEEALLAARDEMLAQSEWQTQVQELYARLDMQEAQRREQRLPVLNPSDPRRGRWAMTEEVE